MDHNQSGLTQAQKVSQDFVGPKAICSCEHDGDGTGSRHEDLHEGGVAQPGHGRCTVRGCTCRQFTWLCWTRGFAMALGRVRPS